MGALLGCAVGDALGAPFEGLWHRDIPKPIELLAEFHEFEGYPRGQYTDDTQLTIATAESIAQLGHVDPEDIARSIAELWRHYSVVGPGGACTRAAENFLRLGDWTTCGAPEGQAGNGTAMRTAILGLCFPDNPEDLPAVVANVSRITHQDKRSVAGGVAIAKAAFELALNPHISTLGLCEAVSEACRPYESSLASMILELPIRLEEPRDTALRAIAFAGQTTPEFDEPIITPYVVPTVLAALFCVLQHPSSWSDAVAAAVGIGGDVDTLGAIVGALMGARLGPAAIPSHLSEAVLDRDLLLQLGQRMSAALAR